MGQPAPVRLVELGPGRGTLMRDALRAARAVPAFLDAATLHLVEASRPLRELQRTTLASSVAAEWHAAFDSVPDGPSIVIANEFLDALPIRQLIFVDGAWHERVVALDANERLQFACGPVVAYEGALPGAPAAGAILELRAGEDELIAALAGRAGPQVALLIDYGPGQWGYGDTLQAVHRHAYVDPLAAPGSADLTAHVQFARLAAKARAAGLDAHGPITQVEFLGRLGIVERAARLMSANPMQAAAIEAGVQRLLSPTGMGGLFKAVAIMSPGLPPPPALV
jgi:SAM-dependent MidA family methyltransferase